MKDLLAAMLVAASCAGVAQAQTGAPPAPAGGMLTLDQAVAAAGGAAPALQAADAAVDAARAGREVAGLRPNPVVQGQVENIAGSGAFRGLRSAETTVGVMVPIELGGKRGARVAVATAQLSRAELQAAIAAADVRAQVSELYVEAVAADRRLATARDQLGIAEAALRAASIRVQAGRASPLEQQRADVVRITAAAQVERTARLADTVRGNLARRIGRAIDIALDPALIDRVPAPVAGPEVPVQANGTLALAAADADLAVADAGVRLARANRVPDLDVGPAVRRLEATNDMAAVFSLSVPIPVFNTGRAAIGQAAAERTRAEAVRRMAVLDVEQAIADARAEVANAATLARAASGPALSAAQEAARIARIGYREGKFGQLDLLDAERTLADTRLAAIDALASYHIARARLERLTAPVPITGTNF
ncbi:MULTISPECIES: TolC family protein [unclassified Sphingomonas]|uniref:TolC family protein n=1 Tax=unclassified Sphingomonas TaxID=196159 RepID=UPI0006F62871|nr:MULTISPECIES: TolC family protein [unclassified Sphingomonas]KQM26928.1 transporter [Sphingomonas sp. Leaf9]KQM43264.1 transporter [Sphingomonas sp. Leaf11]